MIPIHDFTSTDLPALRVVKLDTLTQYDTTQPHRHNYFELFIFDQGEGTHDIDFQSFPIASKSIHIVAPGQVHRVRRELDTHGYVILFDLSAIQSNSPVADFLYDHISYDVDELNPTYQFSGATAERMIQTAETIWNDYYSDNKLKTEFIQNHLHLLCILCFRTLEPEQPDGNSSNATYREFRRLLRGNFKTAKKVKDYAAALNISERKLNEIVSQKTGASCSTLIYKQIILEAKRLLNANLSAKEVAYKLNFDDPAHFSKFFKRQTGQSPTHFVNVHD